MVRKPRAGVLQPQPKPPSLDKRRGLRAATWETLDRPGPMLTYTDGAMPLPVIAGVVRITYRGSMPSGTQWANVIHARYSGGASSPGTSDIVALDAALRRLYTGAAYGAGAAWLTYCSNTVGLIDATAYVLNGTSIPQLININVTGSVAGNQEPQEVAHVVTVRSAVRGRSYRGRIYLPACKVQYLDASGNLATAQTTAVLAQLAGITSALGGPSVAPFWELGVASYKNAVFTPVNTWSMDTRPDVQRRRKR